MKKYQMASTMRIMSKPLPPSRTAPQFVIRFPDEKMRDRIAEAAKKSGRSMNAEIINRLNDSFLTRPTSDKIVDAIMDRFSTRMSESLDLVLLDVFGDQKAEIKEKMIASAKRMADEGAKTKVDTPSRADPASENP